MHGEQCNALPMASEIEATLYINREIETDGMKTEIDITVRIKATVTSEEWGNEVTYEILDSSHELTDDEEQTIFDFHAADAITNALDDDMARREDVGV